MSDEEHYQKGYGAWAGNPKGRGPDFTRCCQEVFSGTMRHFYQCGRKRGHGPGLAYCKQHDPEAVKAKREAKERENQARWAAEKAARDKAQRVRVKFPEYEAALKAIAEGHDDPRTLARNVLGAELLK